MTISMLKDLIVQNFRRYGRLIEYPAKHLKGNKRNLWRIVLTEPRRTGWRIAYLVLRDKTIGRLECHPDSFESFEPVKGRCLMFVSKSRDLNAVECFELTSPIILNKGIWHGLVALTDECEIKITENASVKCEYWPLGFRINKEGL